MEIYEELIIMADILIAIFTTLGWIGSLAIWMVLAAQGLAASRMLKRYISIKFFGWSVLVVLQSLYYLDLDLRTLGTTWAWLGIAANDAMGQIAFRGILAIATWNFIREILRPQTIVTAAIPEAQIQIDSYGKVISWDDHATQMFGWSESEVLNQELAEFIIPLRYREAHRQGLARFRDTGLAPIKDMRLTFPACTKAQGEKTIEFRIKETLTTSHGTVFTAMCTPYLVIK